MTDLQQRVSDVLWTAWDPIGINQNEDARDEYDSYVPRVVQLLLDGTPDDLRKHLTKIETENMGLTAKPARTDKVVQLLLDLKIS